MNEIRTNPTLEKLLSGGARNGKAYWGYVGPSTNDATVLLYSSLVDLSTYMEISRADIVAAEKAPTEALPFGGTVVWLKKGADVTIVRATDQGPAFAEDTNVPSPAVDDNFFERQAGRLLLKVRNAKTSRDCSSRCVCGKCEHCSSRCK